MLEVLLSIATITIIASISIPVYQSFQTRNDLDIAVVETVESARRAQILSEAVDGDISWGIKAQNGGITVFKGASYITRDVLFDEAFNVPANITISGISEIVFSKFFGLPQTTGVIVFTSNAGETKNITINSKGMIDY